MNIEEAQDIVLKGKEMPVGTVSNGYKKEAKGKWVKVTEEKKDTVSDDFNLKEPKTVSDVHKNVKKILEQYASREMANIKVRQYLGEINFSGLGKRYLEDKKITSPDGLKKYLSNIHTAARKNVVAEKRAALKKFDEMKTQSHISNIMDLAESQSKEMDKRVEEYSKQQGSSKLNIATLPVAEARKYAEAEFKKAGQDLNKVLPNFDKNYQSIQNACKAAIDVPRSEMPVVTQKQIDKYKEKLSENNIRYAEGKISAKYLKPTQSQIWLDKIVKNIIKFGPPSKNNSTVLDQVTISSSDNRLADGHHRYGQTMLSDPNLSINSLKVNLPIKKLLKDSKSFGESQGNVSRT